MQVTSSRINSASILRRTWYDRFVFAARYSRADKLRIRLITPDQHSGGIGSGSLALGLLVRGPLPVHKRQHRGWLFKGGSRLLGCQSLRQLAMGRNAPVTDNRTAHSRHLGGCWAFFEDCGFVPAPFEGLVPLRLCST